MSTAGEVDLWANGWFPSANAFLEDDEVKGEVETVGYEVKADALQGYMIDKKTAATHGIATLADLNDPKIARLFDIDGNGRADLIGCNSDWACKQTIEHHID